MRQIRTEQNELRFEEHSFCVSQQYPVGFLKRLRIYALLMGLLVPDVVDSDQDRNNVRTQIDAVLFPAGKQIRTRFPLMPQFSTSISVRFRHRSAWIRQG